METNKFATRVLFVYLYLAAKRALSQRQLINNEIIEATDE